MCHVPRRNPSSCRLIRPGVKGKVSASPNPLHHTSHGREGKSRAKVRGSPSPRDAGAGRGLGEDRLDLFSGCPTLVCPFWTMQLNNEEIRRYSRHLILPEVGL